MLRTNTKKARENIQKYIMDNFDGTDCGIDPPETFNDTAKIILSVFRDEKYSHTYDFNYYHGNEYAAFRDWCAGLASVLDTCYYYNRSAVDDLGEILEETDGERAKYSEQDAEEMLTRLIYRELTKAEE